MHVPATWVHQDASTIQAGSAVIASEAHDLHVAPQVFCAGILPQGNRWEKFDTQKTSPQQVVDFVYQNETD